MRLLAIILLILTLILLIFSVFVLISAVILSLVCYKIATSLLDLANLAN